MVNDARFNTLGGAGRAELRDPRHHHRPGRDRDRFAGEINATLGIAERRHADPRPVLQAAAAGRASGCSARRSTSSATPRSTVSKSQLGSTCSTRTTSRSCDTGDAADRRLGAAPAGADRRSRSSSRPCEPRRASPGVGLGAGHYESFYIKATRPGGGRAVWIRHTVHKRPGAEPTGVDLVHALRRRGAGPAGDQADRPGGRACRCPTGALHRGRRAALEPGRARGAADTDALDVAWDLALRARRRGVPPPALLVPLRRAAAEDEVPLARIPTPASPAR